MAKVEVEKRIEEIINRFIVITGYRDDIICPLNWYEREKYPIGSIAAVEVISNKRTVIRNLLDPCLCVGYFRFRIATMQETFMCIIHGGGQFINGDEVREFERIDKDGYENKEVVWQRELFSIAMFVESIFAQNSLQHRMDLRSIGVGGRGHVVRNVVENILT